MDSKIKLPPLSVSVSVAKKSDLTELKNEMDQFYSKMTHVPESKNEVVFVARENVSGQRKIVGYVKGRIIKDNGEKLGEVLVVSTRKGLKHRRIGPKLVGKLNSYFIARRVHRAELVSLADEFYMKRSNYKPKATEANDPNNSIKTLEAHLKRKAARRNLIKKNFLSKQTIAPQNILNKDRLLKARMRIK